MGRYYRTVTGSSRRAFAGNPSSIMTDASAAMAAVSIGNYKGVMLCNRPFNGVSTSASRVL